MPELTDASDEELAEEVERRGLLPRCPCARWQTYFDALDLNCRGCMLPVNRCSCAT